MAIEGYCLRTIRQIDIARWERTGHFNDCRRRCFSALRIFYRVIKSIDRRLIITETINSVVEVGS